MSSTEDGAEVRELSKQSSRTYRLEGVDEPRKCHLWFALKQDMDMVLVRFLLQDSDAELLGHAQIDVLQPFSYVAIQYPAAILDAGDIVELKRVYSVATLIKIVFHTTNVR